MRAAQVDRDLGDRLLEIERVDEFVRRTEEHLAGNGIRTVIRRFIQFRTHREVVANLVGEKQRGQ